jgi:uncharacterized protein involved in exopolysaccharide biosynthesis
MQRRWRSLVIPLALVAAIVVAAMSTPSPHAQARVQKHPARALSSHAR